MENNKNEEKLNWKLFLLILILVIIGFIILDLNFFHIVEKMSLQKSQCIQECIELNRQAGKLICVC